MKRARAEISTLPKVSILLWTLLLAFRSFPAAAAPIHVPADYSTIQAAINAATDGDEVIVSPGTYTENIAFPDFPKRLVVRSTDPTSPAVVEATIIDGNQSGPVVQFWASTPDFLQTLAGFTITNGWTDYGGGIAGGGNHATIRHNVIRGNRALAYGGGLHGCHGIIEDNIISGNRAEYYSGQGSAFGGGLAECNAVVQNNIITGNVAWAEGTGSPLYDPWYGSGGGLYACNGTIRNNTISGNVADGGFWGGVGGGLSKCNGEIRNCIIWGNSATWGTQLYSCSQPSYSCIQDWSGGTGNIALDPRLNGARLSSDSPCIDAGGTVPLTLDYEGDLRPYDFVPEPRGDGSDFDIGADEAIYRGIATEPAALDVCQRTGTNADTQTLTIWAGGSHVSLIYTIETTPTWLSVNPAGGNADPLGARNPHQAGFQTSSLPQGDHAGAITITAPGATNSPARVPVRLRVGSLTVVSPAGGESWLIGSSQTIQWESHGPCDRVRIELRRPGYTRLLAIAPNAEGTNRFSVALPRDLNPANDYVIHVAWTPCAGDVSDDGGPITMILDPRAEITWPTTGTLWPVGAIGLVKMTCWGFPRSGQMEIELWRAGGYVQSLARVSFSNGRNSWAVSLPSGLTPGPNYQIRLRWTDNTSMSFWSGRFRTARTIFVPHDYPTVQRAIDAAGDGNAIVVSPGTYAEAIAFNGKNIIVRSTNPWDSSVVAGTILRPAYGSWGSVVTFSGSEGSTCVLSGFTITGGGAERGGGICGFGTHATIEYNVITRNRAPGRGAGIYECHGTIQNNVISDNTITDVGVDDPVGAGLCRCNGIIQNNVIAHNTVSGGYDGYGGGLAECDGTIQNNIIFENLAEAREASRYAGYAAGGGLWDCDGLIRNNTIWSNSASGTTLGSAGGGLSACNGTIRNCIIWGNGASTGPQLHGSSEPTFSCIQSWSVGTGNFAADPRVANSGQMDFHLLPDSPCIDAGGTVTLTQDFEGHPRPFDFTSLPRGDGSNFDVGADEAVLEIATSPTAFSRCIRVGDAVTTEILTVWSTCGPAIGYSIETTASWLTVTPQGGYLDGPASATIHRIGYQVASLVPGVYSCTIRIVAPSAFNSRVSIPVRLVILPQSPTTITVGKESSYHYTTIQEAIDVATTGETVLVYPFTYNENIQLRRANITVRSTDPTSPAIVGATIIDGGRAGSVVTFTGSELSSCILAGFTIRNGSARLGGGICGNGTRATVHHNLISSNSALGTSPNWGRGGGLYACNGAVEGNRILANSSDYGGGLCDCRGMVQNNGIANNSARKDGGGLRECTGTIWNNTIVSNTATASGGGLSNCPGTIRNCIVWSNTAATSPQLSNASLPSYSCIQNWTGGGTGNLSADPLVAAPWRGDFHLLDGSPCIDAGGTVPLAFDFEGEPRPYDLTPQPRGDGSNFDIGADEAISPPTMFGITRPTSGTVWQAGLLGNLAFTCRYLPSASQADVELWKAGTSVTSLGRVACHDGPNTASLRLPATVPAGTNYRIRMFWTSNRAFNSWSQGFAVIAAPTIAVTWPTTGTKWQAGTRGNLAFTCANLVTSGQMYVYFWDGSQYQHSTLVACQNGNNIRPVLLPVSLPAAPNYQIRLMWKQDTSVGAWSGKFPVIAPPTFFAITWPTVATIWQGGTPGAVTWTCASLPTPSRMYVDIWRNGKYVRYWTQVAVHEGSNTVSLRLASDLPTGPDYQLRLSWVENTAFYVWSARFSIERPGQPASAARFRLYR